MLVDSHAHLTAEHLLPEVESVLQRARAAGVETTVTIGTDVEDSRLAVDLAGRVEGVYAAVGVHPHEARYADAASLSTIRDLAGTPQVVALGETGLDYHYDHSPAAAQRAAFEWHLDTAHEIDLPVVVHARDADDDVRAILRAAPEVRGVLHCFTGGRALLDTALERGWWISFSGIITFANFADQELLRAVPADRLLVETDSPYLAPVPHRGKRNEPAFVALVARRAAEIRGEEPAALAERTARNARGFYRLAA